MELVNGLVAGFRRFFASVKFPARGSVRALGVLGPEVRRSRTLRQRRVRELVYAKDYSHCRQ